MEIFLAVAFFFFAVEAWVNVHWSMGLFVLFVGVLEVIQFVHVHVHTVPLKEKLESIINNN